MWRFLEYARRRRQGFSPAAAVSLSEGHRPADTVVLIAVVLSLIWIGADSLGVLL